MSGLLFLSSQDFNVIKTEKGNVLASTIPNFSLVLFYSTACTHCKEFIPIFKKLPTVISGCHIAIANIGTEKRIVEMAKATVDPFRYVPYIMFYMNGTPLVPYDGEASLESLKKFIIDVANNVQKRQAQNKEKKGEGKSGATLPPYSLGNPLSGDKKQNVCFLNFSEAYKGKTG